jgi:glycolate oxidase FAD binding subunit
MIAVPTSSPRTTVTPSAIADVQEAVLFAVPGADEDAGAAPAEGRHPALRPTGRGTKTALSSPGPHDVLLDLSQLTGILDYEPSECTFTALAGTPLEAVEVLLAEHGQRLPFEPPFGARGATLGGTVAAGLNGAGRFRYGGVRDFLIGARFVDGEGRLIRGGGRVVKNAAGFYLHHLLLGSLGRLGVLVELTFKVFPIPAAVATLKVRCGSFADAAARLAEIRRSPFELEAADLEPDGTLYLRIGGARAALPARAAALSRQFAGARVEEIGADEARRFWQQGRDLETPAGGALVKAATTMGALKGLDDRLAAADARRRYSAGGEMAWIWWPRGIPELDAILAGLGLAGVVVLGDAAANPFVGRRPDAVFLERVRRTLDPRGTFGGYPGLAPHAPPARD